MLGLGSLLVVVLGLIGALVVLSIAIDCARLIRRANRIIELLQEQNRLLAAKH